MPVPLSSLLWLLLAQLFLPVVCYPIVECIDPLALRISSLFCEGLPGLLYPVEVFLSLRWLEILTLDTSTLLLPVCSLLLLPSEVPLYEKRGMLLLLRRHGSVAETCAAATRAPRSRSSSARAEV